MIFETLDQIGDIKGKRVLLRADFNVSVKDGMVAEEFRIVKTLPTIRFLVNAGAKVVVISHIDKKEGGSLLPIFKYLLPEFPRIRFVEDVFSNEAIDEVKNLKEGSILLLENLRNWPGEENNTPSFATHLASFGDIFVNDGFSVCHREHASIVSVPKLLPSYAGFLLKDEVENLSKCFNPTHPFIVTLGGAKFDTKIPLIEKFIKAADTIFIGGALANDLFKAKGYFLGDSLVSDADVSKYLNEEKIFLPVDVRTQHKGIRYTKKPTEISVNERIWDIGPETSKEFGFRIENASLIVWNGPMGNYENGFLYGTKELAEVILKSGATTIVGGGDVVTALGSLAMLSKFSFVSTGGAAMLQFLGEESLPGIDALKKDKVVIEKKSLFKKIFS